MPVDPGDRSLALPETPPKWPSLRSVLLFTIYNLCLAALFLALIGVSDVRDVVSGVELDHALLLQSTAPEEAASAGTTVSLPHRCPVELDGRYCGAAYRFTYVHAPANDGQAGDGAVSVYLSLYSGNIRVLLNGAPLADSRWTQTALLSVSGPQLVPLPAPMLKDGANDIDIELETPTIQSAFLGPIHVGADARLRRHFNVSHFLTITLPRLIDGWQIGMGLVMLLIWVARPSDRAYLLFGVILLLHAASSVSAVPVNAGYEFWVRMASFLRIFAGAMAFPFLCLLVGRRPSMPVWVFVAFGSIVMLCVATLPVELFGLMLKVLFIPVIALSGVAGVVVLIRAAVVGRNVVAHLMIGPVLVAILLAAHDHSLLANLSGEPQVLLTRYSAAVLMAGVGGILMWRFARTLALQEQFNAQLTRAIAVAEDKLRQSFRREREATRRADLEAERVRLMGDLHDGIAGQLVLILSLSELRGDPSDEISRASRQALVDLRLVVASLEDVGDDLGMMLGLFRERIEPRTRASGIALDWRMGPLPDLPGLNPTTTLTIFRILQEALNNAMRHSGCDTVEVRAGRSPVSGFGVRLTVRDSGRGGAVESPGGFGLRNLRRRAGTLSAVLTIDSGDHGTTVTLDLPERLS